MSHSEQHRIVQKFGGSSVADAESIKRVAQRVLKASQNGNQVVVVISAMGDTTDDLMDLAREVSPEPKARELDMLLTTGERQSAALLAMALSDLGAQALSYTGSQAGVITTAQHGDARIIKMTPGRIEKALTEGYIVIVAGFQGVALETKDVTTLGRGASDTTAVALAASLDAEVCDIYSDVDGVFTADPRIVHGARQLSTISYDEMLELAAGGAKILHLRCVEYARRENVRVHVRSSFSDKQGTFITDKTSFGEGSAMEEAVISGIAHDRSEAKITVVGVPDQPGFAASVFETVAEQGINIDMIVQNVSAVATGCTDITFTLPMSDGDKAVRALTNARDQIGFSEMRYDDKIGKLTIVGVGMRSHPGVTAQFFKALADANINISMISTSEIRISVVVAVEDVDDAVQAAHTAFGLDCETEAVVYAGSGR